MEALTCFVFFPLDLAPAFAPAFAPALFAPARAVDFLPTVFLAPVLAPVLTPFWPPAFPPLFPPVLPPAFPAPAALDFADAASAPDQSRECQLHVADVPNSGPRVTNRTCRAGREGNRTGEERIWVPSDPFPWGLDDNRALSLRVRLVDRERLSILRPPFVPALLCAETSLARQTLRDVAHRLPDVCARPRAPGRVSRTQDSHSGTLQEL